ncbi:ubiquitin-conjugating enzyme/RWD-like protein [Polychytrium aggregatum]|uniref:ubiquitin-conjugating enzyme/RWD-like protein n=1 Tax=Polychytrium aggregatum TaxID=110093 RepID=UPI0022FEB988|nr:ubiquitin-conjugating enzyme/RWD-like protein [Polychytrium aggregatum]KAI9203516.1 ubiquitin-conjugating enzyme/RWD-like protein [Polychytrium aggregatum]
MQSRAALLLLRERYNIQRSPMPWGISADINENNLYHWKARIMGLPETPWEGGIFQVELFFTEEYNEVPPDVYFTTVPFHPNVELLTGKPCLPYLSDESLWDPAMGIVSILMELQTMLANPGLVDPINLPAAQIFECSPHLYDQLVRDCVIASRRIDAGLDPHTDSNDPYVETVETPSQIEYYISQKLEEKPAKLKQISFEEYYEQWKDIATSLPNLEDEPPTRTVLGNHPHSQLLSQEELKDVIRRQRELWYGRFGKPKQVRPLAVSKQDRVNAMMRVYQTERKPSTSDNRSHPDSPLPPLPASLRESNTLAHSPIRTPKSPTRIPIITAIVEPEFGRPNNRTEDSDEEWERDDDGLLEWSVNPERLG